MNYVLDWNNIALLNQFVGKDQLLTRNRYANYYEYKKYKDSIYFILIKPSQAELLKGLPSYISKSQREWIELLGDGLTNELISKGFFYEEGNSKYQSTIWHPASHDYLLPYLHDQVGENTFPQIPTRVILLPTMRCNGQCRFCITESTTESHFTELPVEWWSKTTKRICKELTPLSIDIIGGEPMMRPNVVKGIVQEAVNHHVLVKLITNGVYFANKRNAEEFTKILKNTNHKIQINLDGTADVHNWLRPGVPYDLVLKALENLYELGLNVGIEVTVTNKNVEYAAEICSILKQYDPVYISFGYLQSPPNKSVQELKVTPEQEEELRKCLIDFRKKYPHTHITYEKPKRVFPEQPNNMNSTRKDYYCKAMVKEWAILPDGKITPCLRTTTFKEFVGESIDEWDDLQKLFEESSLGEKFRYIPLGGKCTECSNRDKCDIGCPIEAYLINGEWKAQDTYCNY